MKNKYDAIVWSVGLVCATLFLIAFSFLLSIKTSLDAVIALPPTTSEMSIDHLEITDTDGVLFSFDDAEIEVNSRLMDIILGFITPGSDY